MNNGNLKVIKCNKLGRDFSSIDGVVASLAAYAKSVDIVRRKQISCPSLSVKRRVYAAGICRPVMHYVRKA